MRNYYRIHDHREKKKNCKDWKKEIKKLLKEFYEGLKILLKLLAMAVVACIFAIITIRSYLEKKSTQAIIFLVLLLIMCTWIMKYMGDASEKKDSEPL